MPDNDRPGNQPEVGSWWRHPLWRDRWRVERVGQTYVTLRSPSPGIAQTKVNRSVWPGRWERIRA